MTSSAGTTDLFHGFDSQGQIRKPEVKNIIQNLLKTFFSQKWL